MNKTTKKITTFFLAVLMILLVNSLVLTAGATAVSSKDGDVNVSLYKNSSGSDKGKDKLDGNSPIPGDEIAVTELEAEIIGERVEYLVSDNTPGKLPATGSNTALVLALAGMSAIFIAAYFRLNRNEQL